MSTCRSCGAPVEWGYTAKGRRMPLDPGLHPDGNLEATTREGVVQVRVVQPDGNPRRRSHFVSCPNAGQHRRNRR